jgi:osmotically-inducible protein OsmY
MDDKLTKTDDELRGDVARELAWDTRVAPARVGVEVLHGVVTLTGVVDSWARLRLAEDAAQRVPGVLGVANQLTVALPGVARRSDTEIAQTVRHALEVDVLVPDQLIRSSVSGGVVTLEGCVPLWSQRYDAERAVERLAGVRNVRNRIDVEPTDLVCLEQARDAVETALERHASREATHVSLTANDGTIEVRGIVHSWQARRAVLGAVRGTRGVRGVDDHLHVEP